MKTTIKVINQLCTTCMVLLLTSCYTYKEVFNDKYYVEDNKTEVLMESVAVGDFIQIRINGKTHHSLKVTGIKDQILSVSKYIDGTLHYYTLYIPYIEKLEKQVADPMYTLGVGYTSLLILFFLLV